MNPLCLLLVTCSNQYSFDSWCSQIQRRLDARKAAAQTAGQLAKTLGTSGSSNNSSAAASGAAAAGHCAGGTAADMQQKLATLLAGHHASQAARTKATAQRQKLLQKAVSTVRLLLVAIRYVVAAEMIMLEAVLGKRHTDRTCGFQRNSK